MKPEVLANGVTKIRSKHVTKKRTSAALAGMAEKVGGQLVCPKKEAFPNEKPSDVHRDVSVTWSTERAAAVFDEAFASPARAYLTDVTSTTPSSEFYIRLEDLARRGYIALNQLPESEMHKPDETSTLSQDVTAKVLETVDELWEEMKPKVLANGVTKIRSKHVTKKRTSAVLAGMAGKVGGQLVCPKKEAFPKEKPSDVETQKTPKTPKRPLETPKIESNKYLKLYPSP